MTWQFADGIEQDFWLCRAKPRCCGKRTKDTDRTYSGPPSHFDVFRRVADVNALPWREAQVFER